MCFYMVEPEGIEPNCQPPNNIMATDLQSAVGNRLQTYTKFLKNKQLVEGVGFEPTHRILYGGRFSKPLPSATQPTFLTCVYYTTSFLTCQLLYGGSGEIRTHGPFLIVCFQDRCNKPDSATLP